MFINLRNHTTYSLCKGAITISDLVTKASEFKMPAVGIMDSGNLFAALEFSLAAKKLGIQPIIGTEILVNFADKNQKNFSNLDIENSLAKLPLIATSDAGYKNLMYLVSSSYLNRQQNPHLKTLSPHISFDLLKERSLGLIALSGGADGILNKLLDEDQEKKLELLIKELIKIFDHNNFYIEITRHNSQIEQKYEKALIDLAYKYNIPLVATNDVYFLTKDMHEAQDALMCIGMGNFLGETNRQKLTDQQYFKSQEEMVQLFHDLPEAIENTVNIAKKCHIMAFERQPTLPLYPTKDNATESEELKTKATIGLNKRLEKKFCSQTNINEQDREQIRKEYFARLEYELGVITKMNFSGYFLIVADFINWSKENSIPVGPGRGSGAGSIVAWALQITDLDPIRFGLLFERFLNPERVSMPDFDIDFCQSRRDEVIEYVQKKYGKDYVAQIITFGKLQARAVLKDVGRVMQLPYNQVDRICKLIPFNAIEAVTLQKAIEMDKDLQEAIKQDPQINKLINIALKLEGLNRHASTHAAGIVIGDKPLHEICGLYNDQDSEMPAVGYSMKYAEAAGLVKFDFLGLKTLTVISEAVKLIKQVHNLDLDITNLDLEDQKTFKMLANGDSIGVFQIESSGMRSVLRQMNADKIEDIIALISLYRPGPMDNIPTYIRRKLAQEKITYPHPLLEQVLKETYGVIVYQEQVMEIAKILSGYSLGAADLLRRAMGKKIKEEMDQQREIFVDGAVKNGVNKKQAGEIFDLVDKFAGYGFNKSHAAAYALISYQTAYLKAHYPVEFITASTNLEIDNTDKINIFLSLAKSCGIKILPPDINRSQAYFSIEKL
jgi:DNA polymerase-3 subunit alpha